MMLLRALHQLAEYRMCGVWGHEAELPEIAATKELNSPCQNETSKHRRKIRYTEATTIKLITTNVTPVLATAAGASSIDIKGKRRADRLTRRDLAGAAFDTGRKNASATLLTTMSPESTESILEKRSMLGPAATPVPTLTPPAAVPNTVYHFRTAVPSGWVTAGRTAAYAVPAIIGTSVFLAVLISVLIIIFVRKVSKGKQRKRIDAKLQDWNMRVTLPIAATQSSTDDSTMCGARIENNAITFEQRRRRRRMSRMRSPQLPNSGLRRRKELGEKGI